MPCPPSLEEQSMMRADREEPQARRCARELGDAQALLRDLTRWLEARAVEPSANQKRELEQVLAVAPEVSFGPPPEDWFHDAEKGRQVIEWAGRVSDDLRRLELTLCRARTLLVQLGDLDGVPAAHRGRFDAEVALHAEHREQDRQQVLRNLNARLRRATRAAEREGLEAKIRGLEQTPMERMLRERDCF